MRSKICSNQHLHPCSQDRRNHSAFVEAARTSEASLNSFSLLIVHNSYSAAEIWMPLCVAGSSARARHKARGRSQISSGTNGPEERRQARAEDSVGSPAAKINFWVLFRDGRRGRQWPPFIGHYANCFLIWIVPRKWFNVSDNVRATPRRRRSHGGAS